MARPGPGPLECIKHPRTAHWSIPDPAAEPDGYPTLARVAVELAERIGFPLHTLSTTHVLEVS